MIEANRQAHITSSLRSLMVLLLAVVATLAAACAATPTHESTGGYIDDSTITAKVKTNLAQDSKVSATDVHVKTYKGVVDLSGFVNSESEISEAFGSREAAHTRVFLSSLQRMPKIED